MTSHLPPFSVATGTFPGRAHRRCHRNNQDGIGWRREGNRLMAVVTDGCSSGPFSEVGARLAARWLVTRSPDYLQDAPAAPIDLDRLTRGLLAYLVQVGASLQGGANPGSPWEADALHPEALTQGLEPAIVHDYLLFTFLAAVVDPERFLIFGLGDGLFSVNGRVTVLEPGPDNAPPYVGYRLLEPALLPPLALSPVLHHHGESATLRSLILGTDGVLELVTHAQDLLRDGRPMGGLEPFEQDVCFLRNPSLVQKRLVVIGDVNGRLQDDSSLVLIRAVPSGDPGRS